MGKSVVLVKDAPSSRIGQGLACLSADGAEITSDQWQQNVVTNPVQRNVVVAALRGESVTQISRQDVLEREIILRDDLAPDIIVAAQNRWAQLSQQASMKSGGPPPQGAPSGQPNGNGGPSPFQPSPQTQPLATANPAIGGAPPQMVPTGVGQTPSMG